MVITKRMNKILLLQDVTKIELKISSNELLDAEMYCRSNQEKFYIPASKKIVDARVEATFLIDEGYKCVSEMKEDVDFNVLRILEVYKRMNTEYPYVHPLNIYVRDGEYKFLFPCNFSTNFKKCSLISQLKVLIYSLYSDEEYERIEKHRRTFLKQSESEFFNKIEKSRDIDGLIKVCLRNQEIKKLQQQKKKIRFFKRGKE